MSAYKQCKKCGRSFPMTKKYFNENQTSRDGYQSYCRSCQKKQEVANALKKMRRGARPSKPQPKSAKVPNYSQLAKQRRNDKKEQ